MTKKNSLENHSGMQAQHFHNLEGIDSSNAIIQDDSGLEAHQKVCATEPNEFADVNIENLEGDENLLDDIEDDKPGTPKRHER